MLEFSLRVALAAAAGQVRVFMDVIWAVRWKRTVYMGWVHVLDLAECWHNGLDVLGMMDQTYDHMTEFRLNCVG